MVRVEMTRQGFHFARMKQLGALSIVLAFSRIILVSCFFPLCVCPRKILLEDASWNPGGDSLGFPKEARRHGYCNWKSPPAPC